MTPEKVKQVAKEYENILCDYTPRCLSSDEANLYFDQVSGIKRCSHLRFMAEEIPKLVDLGKLEKAMRWLGWLQGVMYMLGAETLNEAKVRNMPDDEK